MSKDYSLSPSVQQIQKFLDQMFQYYCKMWKLLSKAYASGDFQKLSFEEHHGWCEVHFLPEKLGTNHPNKYFFWKWQADKLVYWHSSIKKKRLEQKKIRCKMHVCSKIANYLIVVQTLVYTVRRGVWKVWPALVSMPVRQPILPDLVTCLTLNFMFARKMLMVLNRYTSFGINTSQLG